MLDNPKIHNIITKKHDGRLLTKSTQIGELNHISTYAGATQNYSYDNDGLLFPRYNGLRNIGV